jgi:HPt (histidine-containing phosphotransfer) domain-containing protein
MGINSEAIIEADVLEKLRQLGGEELLSEMIALFTSHAESMIAEAVKGYETESFNLVRQAAHSLSSSAGNLGAYQLQSLAGQIERLAESRNSATLKPLVAKLQDVYSAAKTRLAEEIQ